MTSLLFFNVSCSLPPPGLCTGCSLPPSTPTSPEVIPPSRLTPHRPMRPGSRSYPPHTVHACRALSTTGVDLGSDLVAQTRLWGCHSTGQACSFRSGLGPSARHREDTPHMFAKGKIKFRRGRRATVKGLWRHGAPKRGCFRSPVTQHGPDLGLPDTKGLHDEEKQPGWPWERIRSVTPVAFSEGPRMDWTQVHGRARSCSGPPRAPRGGRGCGYAGETASWCNRGADTVRPPYTAAGQADRYLYLY